MVEAGIRRALLAVACAGLILPGVGASHAYTQPVWITWDTTKLDVLVLGPPDPIVGSAIEESIHAWRAGIAHYAPGWLAGSLEIRSYFPGRDAVPPPGFEPNDVEIFFVGQGTMAYDPCGGGDPEPCSLGRHCYATAPRPTTDGVTLYHVAAHELGHCLGLAHVFDHDVEYEPAFDIMGIGVPGAHPCPSNLNVLVLERAYGGLFGLPSGGDVTLAASDYEQAPAC